MTLPEAFCRINRARGMELLSPEDVLNACSALNKVNGPVESVYIFSYSFHLLISGWPVFPLV